MIRISTFSSCDECPSPCYDTFNCKDMPKIEDCKRFPEVSVKNLGTVIHMTRAWQALHFELQADLLEDVKKALAQELNKYIKNKPM